MKTLFPALVAAALIAGCASTGLVPRNAEPVEVRLLYGEPDAIREAHGGDSRLFAAMNPPSPAWPPEAERTWYYLDHDLQVTFVDGKARSAKDIDDTREMFVRMAIKQH